MSWYLGVGGNRMKLVSKEMSGKERGLLITRLLSKHTKGIIKGTHIHTVTVDTIFKDFKKNIDLCIYVTVE